MGKQCRKGMILRPSLQNRKGIQSREIRCKYVVSVRNGNLSDKLWES